MTLGINTDYKWVLNGLLSIVALFVLLAIRFKTAKIIGQIVFKNTVTLKAIPINTELRGNVMC